MIRTLGSFGLAKSLCDLWPKKEAGGAKIRCSWKSRKGEGQTANEIMNNGLIKLHSTKYVINWSSFLHFPLLLHPPSKIIN